MLTREVIADGQATRLIHVPAIIGFPCRDSEPHGVVGALQDVRFTAEESGYVRLVRE